MSSPETASLAICGAITVIRAAGAEVTELAYLNIVLDSLNFDGVNLLTQTITASSVGNDGTTSGQTILNAFPNAPDPVTLQLFKPINFFGRIRPISPTMKNPEIREASLSITRQIGTSFVYSIGFQVCTDSGSSAKRIRT